MNSHDIDDRIRDALNARASQLSQDDLRPASAPTGDQARGWRSSRWGAPLLASAAAAILVVGTTVVVSALRSDSRPPAGSSSTGPHPTTSSATTAPNPPADFDLGYQPLWPFGGYAAAELWRAGRARSEPWHLDAGQTALTFTRAYLGFARMTLVTSKSTDGSGAHVGIGYRGTGGRPITAAVLHLVRFGPRADAPWEVVGSDDTDFSLERPAYGSAVSSPITVGGHISGLGDSIHLWIRQPGRAPLTDVCCLPAGGVQSPWQRPVSFSGSGVLTIVAATGGRTQLVERFAIQGVHTR